MNHRHDHAHHDHAHSPASNAVMYAAVGITLAYAAVEAVAGLVAGSLALVSDAGHMVTDAVALGIAAFAAWISRRPASDRHSYGYVRAEIIAAVVNSGFMIALVATIAFASVSRMLSPHRVDGEIVTLVAGIGLGVNLAVAWLLSRGERNLNTRAALLHVMGDLLGSVAALASGLIVSYTGFTLIDPLLSLFICALILTSSLRLLRDGMHALMEGVPDGLTLAEVGRDMAGIAGVVSVHDLHIWALSSNRTALSAHVVVDNLGDWEVVLERMLAMLSGHHHIEHATLQPEAGSRRLYAISEPAVHA
jgi:cobalt-zinc-cadmium efflux system protein